MDSTAQSINGSDKRVFWTNMWAPCGSKLVHITHLQVFFTPDAPVTPQRLIHISVTRRAVCSSTDGLGKGTDSPLQVDFLSQCFSSVPPLSDLKAWRRTKKFLFPKQVMVGVFCPNLVIGEPEKWWPLEYEGNTYPAAERCMPIWQLRRPDWAQWEGHKLRRYRTARCHHCCSHRPGWSACWCCSAEGSHCHWLWLAKGRLLASGGWIHYALPKCWGSYLEKEKITIICIVSKWLPLFF